MTARQVVTLTCDIGDDCTSTFSVAPGATIGQTREAAQAVDWSSDRQRRDGCPDHPCVAEVILGGLLIRLYDHTGHLLYVATTTKNTPGMRLRTLRSGEDWWPVVDMSRTLVERVPADVNLFAEREEIARREHPRFYRDEYGRRPYLHNTRIIEPKLRGTAISRLRARRGTNGRDAESHSAEEQG